MSAWTIVSILGLGAAAVMLLRGEHNAAFVAAALGAVAWFLNYRSHLRSTIPRDEEGETGEQDDEDEDVDGVDEGDASGDDD